MPTVSQHYGHHAVPGAVDETRTRQQAAPVVLMVSGGADSTALLLMACTSKLDIQDGRGALLHCFCAVPEDWPSFIRPHPLYPLESYVLPAPSYPRQWL